MAAQRRRLRAARVLLVLIPFAACVSGGGAASSARPADPTEPQGAFVRQIAPFPVLDATGTPYEHPFLGGFDVPRPQFIDIDAPHKGLAFVALGCLFNVNSLFVNIPVAFVAARAGRRLRGSAVLARWFTGAVGALFVLLAGRLATLERP